MERSAPAWLASPPSRVLFDRFPCGLLLASTEGMRLAANESFDRLVGAGALDAARVADLIARLPRAQWTTLELAGPSGAPIPVRLQVLSFDGGVHLLVVEPLEAAARELERLRERLRDAERLVATDPLTGLWNRAHLDAMVASELARSERRRRPVSLVVADLDHFKQVNDTFGHAAGDALLVAFARLLKENVREADAVFRTGGEEFLVLLPETPLGGARHVAESLRALVESTVFEGVGPRTANFGVAEHLVGESAKDWFARADAALYAAKHAGRNRFESAEGGASFTWNRPAGEAVLKLEWKAEYASGNPAIDEEHRTLFNYANAAISATLGEPAGRGKTRSALDRLLEHIAHHFQHEERILEDAGYAKLSQHRRAHQGLLARARTLAEDARHGSLTTGALVEFIAEDVVARHLLWSDREYFPLFATAPAPAS